MVLKFPVWFPPAGENRRIHLYLPEGYYQSEERYPVVYMFDGHNLYYDEDATFGKCLGLKAFLDGWQKKLIVVGIECSDKDLQRVHEYCPYSIYSQIYGEINGRGDETMKWIVNELKPLIDRTYRTWPFREATAIGGYSMGGMMSLYAVLRYNQYFSKSAVISPAILPAMEAFQHEIWDGSYSPDTRLFFSWGTEEYPPDRNQWIADSILYLEKEVQKKGIRTYICCQQGGRHNEASWEQQVPVWMKFLWEDSQ